MWKQSLRPKLSCIKMNKLMPGCSVQDARLGIFEVVMMNNRRNYVVDAVWGSSKPLSNCFWPSLCVDPSARAQNSDKKTAHAHRMHTCVRTVHTCTL